MKTCSILSTPSTHSATLRPSQQRRQSPGSIAITASLITNTSSQTSTAFSLLRRQALLAGGAALVAGLSYQPVAQADDFIETTSGLFYQDIKVGQGAKPKPGDTVAVHWAGYTKNYQAKKIDNTSVRDEPYEFVLGAHQVS